MRYLDRGTAIEHCARGASIPHPKLMPAPECGTRVGAWHSVPNGDPAGPYAPATPFTGVVAVPMLTVPKEAQTVDVGGRNPCPVARPSATRSWMTS